LWFYVPVSLRFSIIRVAVAVLCVETDIVFKPYLFHVRNAHNMADSESSASDSFPQMWEVLDILGQRTGKDGQAEVLVIWKATWIPRSELADGPMLRAWLSTTKSRQDVLIDAQLCAPAAGKAKRGDTDSKRGRPE